MPAASDFDAEVPPSPARDDIGEMATALPIFRDALVADCDGTRAAAERAHEVKRRADQVLALTRAFEGGGGLRERRAGEEAIRRASPHASPHLEARGTPVAPQPIGSDPGEAALIGAAHLFPSDLIARRDIMLAVDTRPPALA